MNARRLFPGTMVFDMERLQKIISTAGVASRRKAETLIREGRVTVNGQIVTELGSKADPARDHIKVDGKLIRSQQRRTYILLNKPRNVISTVADPQGRTKVTDLIKSNQRIYPVGRLDYESEGVILLTNDGEFARVVSSAGTHLPKVYLVKVRSTPDATVLERLRAGVKLEDGTFLTAQKIVPVKIANNSWYEVTLTQGKNRQIRRMFERVGHPILKLYRKRIGFLSDNGLPIGHYRTLTPQEVARVLELGRQRQMPRKSE